LKEYSPSNYQCSEKTLSSVRGIKEYNLFYPYIDDFRDFSNSLQLKYEFKEILLELIR
jgi:hypothetical protein